MKNAMFHALLPQRFVRRTSIFAGLLLGALAAQAQVIQGIFDTFGGHNNLTIPDGNPTGASDTRTIATSLTQIQSVTVTLDLTSQFNGDLYAYLAHGNQMSVLLNRAGRDGAGTFGYADQGFNVTLADGAANGDIHIYQLVSAPPASNPLTGFWQPDGRAVDPDQVKVNEAGGRSAPLSVFNGQDPNGSWTLFVADLNGGGVSALDSWGLQITAVPEPAETARLVGGLLVIAAFWRFCRKRRARSLNSIWPSEQPSTR